MRKVVLKMDMSLDGYVGPVGEDAEWILRDFDGELGAWVVDEVLWQAGTHVMGRTTYEEMADYWPSSNAEFAVPMNEIPKVVFSKTLTSAGWPELRVASGDLGEEISRLREEPGKDILVHGGAKLVQSLNRAGLIDEYRIIVHPTALGEGAPLFGAPTDLSLVDSRVFGTGAVALTYEPRRGRALAVRASEACSSASTASRATSGGSRSKMSGSSGTSHAFWPGISPGDGA